MRTGHPRRALAASVASVFMLTGLASTPGTGAANQAQAPVQRLVARLTLRQKIGQMMMVSFAGTALSPSAKAMIRQIQPGGITLFGDNFSSTSQLTALDGAAQRASRIPLFISVDQEGGYVIRVTSGVKQLPSEEAYGRQNNPTQVKSDASTEATQLHRLGINMNLAPVLDVATPNSVIGREARSYGPNSSVVTRLGLAAIKGYQSRGIAATAKHVVGLGTTTTDPESKLPHLNLPASTLANQLSPFKAAARSGVDSLMVTHVIIKGVTASATPASLSRKVVTGILRRRFGYDGVIMTDSLTMGAVLSHFGLGTASTMAIAAGEDILLIAAGGQTNTTLYQEAVNAVVAKVDAGKIPMATINASVTRILTLKRRLGLAVGVGR